MSPCFVRHTYPLSDREQSQVTELLLSISRGDGLAADELLPLVYEELRRLAHRQIAAERPGQTLQATALVHEAYLRLVRDESKDNWENRRHFFGAAARAMRRIMVERSRQRAGPKRGGDHLRVPLNEGALWTEPDPSDVLALDEALAELECRHPRANEIVMLRYFAGLSLDETARSLGISERTVKRDWRYGKAWLFDHIRGRETPDE